MCDTIRNSLRNLTLDQAIESNCQRTEEVPMVMATNGINIVTMLVTEMSSDVKVCNSMNEINASKRLKESSTQRAEGEKILKLKRAEVEAESICLSGVGVARQRKAIMLGFK